MGVAASDELASRSAFCILRGLQGFYGKWHKYFQNSWSDWNSEASTKTPKQAAQSLAVASGEVNMNRAQVKPNSVSFPLRPTTRLGQIQTFKKCRISAFIQHHWHTATHLHILLYGNQAISHPSYKQGSLFINSTSSIPPLDSKLLMIGPLPSLFSSLPPPPKATPTCQ